MINTKITIGVTVDIEDVKKYIGCDCDSVSREDVSNYIYDKYGEGLGCDMQILGCDDGEILSDD